MSSCLPCADPVAPCACPAGVACIQVGRSCNQCTQNICQASTAPVASGGGGGSSPIGGTVGSALGGVLGIIAAILLVYWFWWRPRGRAASRKRYSAHITARQSKVLSLGEKRAVATALGGARTRTSVHMDVDTGVLDGIAEEDEGPASTRATAGDSQMDEHDNPFSDHARSSIGTYGRGSTYTSDFSFRSSQSTNIIPIAYIPPHSGSTSIEDSNRGGFGEILSFDPRSSRQSMGMDLDRRDSLALAGADFIDLNPPPAVLTPGSPAIPHSASTTANGAPIRPPRSPGLDLKLPESSPTSPLVQGSRPSSGFPWHPLSPTRDGPSPTGNQSYLNAPYQGGRGLSVLLERNKKNQSHLSVHSTMSSSTSRSDNSTMSYILDPPQIITPVNAQGLRRIEVMGREQAGLVRIGGTSSAGNSPAMSSPASPRSDESSPSTPRALGRFATQQGAANPFSDDASVVTPMENRLSAVGGTPLSPLSDDSRPISRATVETTDAGYVTNESRWMVDSAGPDSVSIHGAETERADSRLSYASTRSQQSVSLSIMDGMQFSTPQEHKTPLSPLFPLPPTRAPSAPSSPTATTHPLSSLTLPESKDTSPLPSPFLPFAGQRPTSTHSTAPSTFNASRVQSQAISIRSGFGSGLSQIPFQLGFPSGLAGGSERGSIMTTASGATRDSRSYPDDEDEFSGPEGARRGSTAHEEDDEMDESSDLHSATLNTVSTRSKVVDPFGVQAEVEGKRESSDTLALSAELARSFEGLD